MSGRGLPTVPQKKEKTQEELDAQMAHRREKAVAELCSTETTYCTLLGLLIQNYVTPLADNKILQDFEHATLFPQLVLILGLSEKFLQDLDERRSNDWNSNETKLSDLFEKFTPFFKMYQGYVNGHEKAVNLMRTLEEREKWIEYMKNVRKHCKGFDLSSLLILPIQRIPRYKLLLSEIVKNTRDTHPDFKALSIALAKVNEVSHEINERMKEFERRETVKLIELSFKQNLKLLAPHRQFIKRGKLNKVCRNKDRMYHFFLFNDVILYASTYGSKYSLHNQLPIDATFNVLWINEVGKYGQEKADRLFQIISAKKSFVVFGDTMEDAKEWFDAIHQALIDQESKRRRHHNKQESTSAAIWVPDTHQNNCTICNDKFTFVNRRHHCRRCGALVCGRCSKFKLPNAEAVAQRACRTCYFQMNSDISASPNTSGMQAPDETSVEDDSSEDEYEKENTALNNIPYYIDVATAGTLTSEDLFNKFGHGIGSYLLVPIEQGIIRTDNGNNGGNTHNYYTVTLVVHTQNGFEPFIIQLFSKKNSIVFRLDRKDMKRKDFSDMHSLILYIEKKRNFIFSYAIPRSEVYNTQYNYSGKWSTGHQYVSSNNNNVNVNNNYNNTSQLENYPKARALFDYEAEVLGDLTLRTGDIVYIVDREDGNGWWTGVINDRTGLFPSTYVEVIEEKPIPASSDTVNDEPNEGDILIARFNYYEGGQEELRFSINDRIILQAKDESGWWLGQLEKTGVVGWFAPDLVVPADTADAIVDDMSDNIAKGNSSSDGSDGSGSSGKGSGYGSGYNSSGSVRVLKKKSKKNKKVVENDIIVNGGSGTKSIQQSTSTPVTDNGTTIKKRKSKSSKNKKKRTSKKKKKKLTDDENTDEQKPVKSKKSKSKKSKKVPKPSGNKKSMEKLSLKQPPPVKKGRKAPKSPIAYKKVAKPKAPVKKSNNNGSGGLSVENDGSFYTYEELKSKKLPENVDRAKLEDYLSDEDFRNLFECSREEFKSNAAWKQISMKKKLGLF